MAGVSRGSALLTIVLSAACGWAGPAPGAPAAAWVPTARTVCDLAGWSTDRDPRGLNVRAAADAKARVAGVLPPRAPLEEGGPNVAVSFRITGSDRGWLQITEANDESAAARRVYAGPGWISGRMVGFNVQSTKGFARPDAKSRVVVAWGRPMEDLARVERVVACSGEWALIEGRYRPAGDQALGPGERPRTGVFTAWVRGVCGGQTTTCDGAKTD